MLTFSQSMQVAALVLGAVMLTLGLGFWAGHKSAHSRPRLGGFVGFLAIVAFAFGPLAILTSTMKFSISICLAVMAGWLVTSGMAWGVVMTHYGKGRRGSFNVWFLQAMYLVGVGVVVSGLVFSQLAPSVDIAKSAEDVQLWGRQVGVFSITAMVYGAFGLFVLWMNRWTRSGMAQATPLVPDEQFTDVAVQPAPVPVSTAPALPAAAQDRGKSVKDASTSPVASPKSAVAASGNSGSAAINAPPPPAVSPVSAPELVDGSSTAAPAQVTAPPTAKDDAGTASGAKASGGASLPPEEARRTKLILRNGEGKLSE
jgi:hypothetical protein